MLTGSEAARLAGVNQSTWSRWVTSGKAPAPSFTNAVNITLFRRKEVEDFLTEESAA